MKKFITLALAAFAVACSQTNEMEIQNFITELEQQVEPLRTASGLAYWNGANTGEDKYFEEYASLSMELTAIFTDKSAFEKLKAWKDAGIKDSLLQRQVEVLYNSFLSNQADPELLNKIIEKESLLEQKYARFRANLGGELINDNRVEEILHQSTDSKELQKVWEAHKAIGPFVAEDVLEIVRLRNELARSLGFENYHSMSLLLDNQNPEEITALFDRLDNLTREGFASVKAEMDAAFSSRCNIKESELMPWHYQGRFFQEAPDLYPVNLDPYYKGKSLEDITSRFYSSIGLDVTGILKNSDLYPREGKNQHAFCADLNSRGDVRVLCNLSEDGKWMGTMLHEFGHGVYSLGHDNPANPYFLRESAHTFTTEAVAMLFERLSSNPAWLSTYLGIPEAEAVAMQDNCFKQLRLQQLVFSRWVQVVYRFEKEMYANPEQDLNTLWWDLVENYQMLRRPEDRNMPDWASKIHIALYPCYYHNYMLGELFASQMHYYILSHFAQGRNDKTEDVYSGNLALGKWMRENVFEPGMRYPWEVMIEKATGEPLSAQYYTKQFVTME